MSADDYQGAAKRCSNCDVNWPNASYYEKCPGCEQPTWESLRTKPLDPGPAADEAKRMRTEREQRAERHEAFEQYYADREVARLMDELDSPLC